MKKIRKIYYLYKSKNRNKYTKETKDTPKDTPKDTTNRQNRKL